ncbi:MAG TPA: hemerythrin domain-containing protein [Bryobacteraceae bacterium]
MPVNIGGKAQSGFNDPFGLLWDCHRRIEGFLAALVKAAELGPERTGEAERESLRRALDHFRGAGQKHTEDEEASVFPRLRAACESGDAEALRALESLESDHDNADRLHAELDLLGREWIETATLPQEKMRRFREIALRLKDVYARHIALEDTEVFPLAKRKLTNAEVRSIGDEMARRRGLAQRGGA